jgi:hypothetical protein
MDVEFDAEIVVRREMGRSLVFLMVRAAGLNLPNSNSASSNGNGAESQTNMGEGDQQTGEEELSAGDSPGLLQITLDQSRYSQNPTCHRSWPI